MKFAVNFDNNNFFSRFNNLKENKNKFINEVIKVIGDTHAFLENDIFYVDIDSFEDISKIENIVGDIRKDNDKFLFSFSPKFNVISVEFGYMYGFSNNVRSNYIDF